MMNNPESILVEGLVWRPGKDSGLILDHVNAMLHSGDFYGILGPNGAGKSSFVRQLVKLNTRNEGSIGFEQDGEKTEIDNIGREQLAGLISFLPQSIGSDVDFSVYDVVAMGREPHRKRFQPLGRMDREKIDEALEFTNCLQFKNRSIQQLSGGERQRVMIARTIAQDTPWIILDEPVSSLDIKHQYELMKVLERLRQEKSKTVIAILHDLNLASAFCNKLILMMAGKVYTAGETRKVLTPENLEAVYGMEFELIGGHSDNRQYIIAKM